MKILKFLSKCILIFIFVSFVFWAVIVGLLQTEKGQKWAFNQLSALIEKQTHTQVHIGKANFSFPLSVHLEDIIVSQDDRPLVKVQELKLSCVFSKLLQGRLVFSTLQLSHVKIDHLPEKTLLSNSQQDNLPWDKPFLPFYVKIENLDIQNVKINDEIIKKFDLLGPLSSFTEHLSWNLKGMLSNNPFRESITAHLLLSAHHPERLLPPCHLEMDTQNHQLSFSFQCNKFSPAFFDSALPSSSQINLAFYSSAPVSSWQNFSILSSKDIPIKGNFKIHLKSPFEESYPLTALLGPQTSLKGDFDLFSLDFIHLFDVKLDNPHFFAEGNLDIIDKQTIQKGNLKGRVEDFQSLQPLMYQTIAGSLDFEGLVIGSLFSPIFDFHLNSAQLQFASTLIQNISTHLQAQHQEDQWKGSLDLEFNQHDIPWQMTTLFNWKAPVISLHELKAKAIDSDLKGEIDYDFTQHIAEGLIQIQTQDIQSLSNFFNVQTQGSAQLALTLKAIEDSHQQKQQGIQAKLTADSFKWEDYQAKQLIFNLSIDPLQERKGLFNIRQQIEGNSLSWKDYSIENLEAHTSYQFDINESKLINLIADWKADTINSSSIKMSQATGKIELKDPLKEIEGKLALNLLNIQTDTSDIENLKLQSDIHPHQSPWPFTIQTQGIGKEKINFETAGTWYYQKNLFELNVNDLKGQIGHLPFNLKKPTAFLYKEENIELKNVFLQWGEAELQFDYEQDSENFLSEFKTNSISTDLLASFIPDLPIKGNILLHGKLEGALKDPKGQINIDVEQMQITEKIFAQQPLITGNIQVDLTSSALQLQSELKGIGQTPLVLEGTLPISFTMNPFKFDLEKDQSLNLKLNAEGEIDPYLSLLYSDSTNLSGQAKIAINLKGNFHHPEIQGNIDLTNGSYESLSTGAIYKQIEAHLEGNGSKIILSRFSAHDNKQGVIEATGDLTLDEEKNFPFAFRILPSHIFLLDSDYASISASGTLQFVGDTKQSKLQGELNIDQAVVHLEAALPQQIKTVEVKYINLPEGDQVPLYLSSSEKNSSVELDIKLVAKERIQIEGNHLKSDWKGAITVTGNTSKPQFNGDLRIAQGEYDFNGKIFSLTQGNIHFAGSADKKTSLYIVASREIDDRVRADIIVKGPVTKPAINFRSNPPMSQREVLSYLLFGRGISDITSDQGEQLSQTFISLNSNDKTAPATDDILTRLRNNIGIDRLDFTTGDTQNKNIGIQIGKNITKNLSVSVNQSVMFVTPLISVEAKITKNIKAQAEAGVNESMPIRLSLKWKKDY